MPPSFVLLLCFAFVLLLLRVEQNGSRDVSAALWIPTLWMLLIGSRPLAAWFLAPGSVTPDNDSGSVLDRWALTALATLAIITLIHRRFDWRSTLRRHQWLLALLALMFISTFWSAFTLIALRRWVRETIALLMVLLLLSEANPRQALASVLRRSAYILVPFSLVLIRYYPALGRAYGRWSGVEMWIGVTAQKNQLGRLCMISAFFLLWQLYRGWRERHRAFAVGGNYRTWADIVVVLIALYLLKGSDSSTSSATLVIGCASYLGLRLFRRLKLTVPQPGLLALVIFLATFGSLTPFLGGTNVAGITSSLGRNSTLTGRTEVWAQLLPAQQDQPLFGYGLGSFWTDARRQSYSIPTAHNGYLDILLELGEVGLAIYMIWLLSLARRLHQALPYDDEYAGFAICFLLMSLVYNISESALNSFSEHMTAVMVLASAVALCKINRDMTAGVETGAARSAHAYWLESAKNDAWSEEIPAEAANCIHPPAILSGSNSTATSSTAAGAPSYWRP